MPYLTTDQLIMLSDALGFFFLAISAMILFTMKTKRYGRRLSEKWVQKCGVNFNNELSLAIGGRNPWSAGAADARKRSRGKRKEGGGKRLTGAYAAAKRLAEQGLNVEGIREKVNLPKNEIELIVKYRRMNMNLKNHGGYDQHGNYGRERLEALRNATEKIARAGMGRS